MHCVHWMDGCTCTSPRQVANKFETCTRPVADLSAICPKQVRDLLDLVECVKLCDPLTVRAIPKRFCDGVGWLAHNEALYQVPFTFTFTLLAGLELVPGVSPPIPVVRHLP